MNLIPKAATHTIVEVKEGSSYSFIVCNNVGMDNGMTYIAGAIMKKTMTLSRRVKYVGGYYGRVYSTEIKHSCDYGVDVSSIILPSIKINNIAMCDSLDEMYPNIKIWSSRRVKDAEEICNSALDKQEKEYCDKNLENFLCAEDGIKTDMAYSRAKEIWNNLSWYKRIFLLKENDFISSTAKKIKDQMIPVEFYKDLEKYGFDYKEWMAK